MNAIRHVIMLVLFASACTMNAATYYVSHNGNDNNTGNSPDQPWRSIARVQQHMNDLQPGDQVLFERGGIYPGRLDISKSGTSGQPIVFGAYGAGNDPIISGGEFVNNWVQHQGNIWRASFAASPRYLLVDHQPMQLARYPNHGWLRNDQGGNSHISTADLGQGNGHWTGAQVMVRTTNYSYESSVITGSTTGTIQFEPISVDLGDDDWGFFICGKLSELDMAGEWYHDANTGQLYLWAPGNANPNDLTILASVYDKGVVPGWQKSHIRVENLTIQGQTQQGISTEVSNNVVITGCTIRHCYNGISSSGDSNQYINNTITNTFGAGMNIYDTNTLIENNVLYDVAVHPGMGEDYWGYWGMNVTGQGCVVRGNRLDNIGYIGIGVGANVLVEKNVVVNATSILNDGAGISFDHCDGVIVRDNLVLDCKGDLESVATSHTIYYPICFGIYFGNTSIKNTIVERNTVARCNGAGIHVDHTMVSTGNQIKDNVLFDNNVQLSLSDYSNYNGPGAAPPFHVPSFNTIYSGNIMYSIRPEQLCMRQFHVYSPDLVDYGTFNNNKYFNPYNEMSIMLRNFQGGGDKYHTLESWQGVFDEDADSERSPLRLSEFEVTEVLGNDQITNGHFDYNVTGWGGWPTQAQVTHSNTYLDNGAMKVLFNNNADYDVFYLHPDQMVSLQNNEYYRLRFSIQSNMSGTLTTEVKKESEMQTPYAMFRKLIPFSPERRDLTIFLRSAATEPARVQWINHFTESTYWLDNVRFDRVQVEAVDPYTRHTLVLNDQSTPQTFPLEGCWSLIDGNLVTGSITVPAYGSVVLQKEDDGICSISTGVNDMAAEVAGPTFHPNPVRSGNSLWLASALEQELWVRLFDVTGRSVSDTRLAAGAIEMPLQGNIRPGVYVLRASGKDLQYEQRIIVD